MKKNFLLFITILIILTFISFRGFAEAANYIKIIVNGQEIQSNVQPMIVNDKIMVPIREIAESLNAYVEWDEEAKAVTIMTKDKISKVVANVPNEGIVLSAVEKDGMYEDFTLEINESKRYFDWENVSNPTYAPKLLLNDINDDGEKELIIILTTGYGTGVYYSNAHVINPQTFEETYIDDPRAIILRNVKTKISENKVEINIGDKKTVMDIDRDETDSEYFFSNITFEEYRSFEVIDDELRVTLGAKISPAYFIGEVEISYMFKDNMYQVSKIEFKKYND